MYSLDKSGSDPKKRLVLEPFELFLGEFCNCSHSFYKIFFSFLVGLNNVFWTGCSHENLFTPQNTVSTEIGQYYHEIRLV